MYFYFIEVKNKTMSDSSKLNYEYEYFLCNSFDNLCKISEKKPLEKTSGNENSERDSDKKTTIESNILCKIDGKTFIIHFNDINKLYSTSSRSDNDKYNTIREHIIISIVNNKIPQNWFENEKWEKFRKNILSEIENLGYSKCGNYDRYIMTLKAGRGNNYDFNITYFNKDEEMFSSKIEFKHNIKSIDKYPQFLNLPLKDTKITKISYPEYFYNMYIPNICKLYEIKIPEKEKYFKYIHNSDYSKLSGFSDYLHSHEMKCNKKCMNCKKRIDYVHESIERFLNTNTELIIDIANLNKKFVKSRMGKIYFCWDMNKFHIDYISNKELNCSSIKGIKNNNTIVLNTESKSEIHMLLRWKNRLGVLYPSWQISLKR